MPFQKNKIRIDADRKWVLDLPVGWYIDHYGYVNGKHGSNHIKLHHLIAGRAINNDFCTDHKNGDKLDNRRSNLRIVPRGFNIFNRPKRKDSKQLYKGISELPSGRFRARKPGGQIGIFDTPEEARDAHIAYFENKYNLKAFAL